MGDASSAHKKRTEGSIDCDVAAPPRTGFIIAEINYS